jgi:hypothetical protein
MTQDEILILVCDILEHLGLRYFVTGSVATIFFGEARFTNDIDIVVDLPPRLVETFCRSFPPDQFYVSEEAARSAVQRNSQFNILHPSTAMKVDIMIPSHTDFNRSRFSRASRLTPSPGRQIYFTTPEDIILMKLEYYRQGGSDKHLRDIAGILKITGSDIDVGYIEHWAARLGLSAPWQSIRARAGSALDQT